MAERCPVCGQPPVANGGEELAPDERNRIVAEMLRARPSQVPESEALPFEAMQAAPGMALAMDEGGEPLQTTPEEVVRRGLRPIPPGGVPVAAQGSAQLATALRRATRR